MWTYNKKLTIEIKFVKVKTVRTSIIWDDLKIEVVQSTVAYIPLQWCKECISKIEVTNCKEWLYFNFDVTVNLQPVLISIHNSHNTLA